MTGGGWGYALNSNDSAGDSLTTQNFAERMLDEQKRMLAYYVIGWRDKEVGLLSQGLWLSGMLMAK